jgi:hypothetical protein
MRGAQIVYLQAMKFKLSEKEIPALHVTIILKPFATLVQKNSK